MSEEDKGVAVTEKADPRESPAFKGVVKQLDEARKQAADLASQVAQLTEVKQRQELESKGQYEAALKEVESTWSKKLSERESELARIREAHEVASLELSLASAGVQGRARTYLAKDYAALGADKPELSAWVESVKANPEYSSFFVQPAQSAESPRQVRAGDGAGRSAGGMKTEVDWAQVRADIISPDPRKSGPAIRQMSEYIRQHGASPPKEK
jgi:uncharacterized membrane protein YqiK